MLGSLRTFALLTLLVAGLAGATPLAWVNGDFELSGETWSAGPGTSFGDFDGDGDKEARLAACVGEFGLSRGISKGVVPATTPLTFEVETGAIVYDIGMILADTHDPEPYANNLFWVDATGTLQPDWFDDQVLYWKQWTPVSGTIVLDPLQADQGVNIPGWDAMDAQQRAARLSTMTHMTMVMYTCAHGATVDDFAWVL